LSYLPLSVTEALKADTRFKITPDRDNFDYIYSVKELAELPGAKFHDKKNLVNQFKKKYKYVYRPICPDIVKQCLQLEEDWCRMRNCLENESSASEHTCIEELLTHFKELSLFGGAILIEGVIQAFTILQEMDSRTAVTHVEKANTKFKGAYQAINNFIAESIADKYAFLNREEDLGEPGLRKAKMSYNPIRFAEKYHAEISRD